MAIEIFQSERDAGLEEKLLATAAIAYCVPVLSVGQENCTKAMRAANLEFAKATNVGQIDLHYLNTIMASSGWNKNDDISDIIELFMARHTAEDKPFNLEHDCANIIGHITGCSVFDAEMNPVDDSITDFSQLPSKIHVVTGAVLYKVWPKPELQERMDTILEEIAKGEWFVSMEALLSGFDYAMKDSQGNTRVIARNSETAFLTKYLRAYGGTGKYGDYVIGRVLRNIVFCGKGLVRKPANPESVILDDPDIFDGRTSAKEIPENFEEKILVPENLVYSGITGNANPESEQMKTVEELTAIVAERDTTIASLQSAADKNVKTIETVQASLAEANGKISALEQTVASTSAAKAAVDSEVSSLKTEIETAKASLNTVNTELGEIKAKAKRAERLVVVASKLSANEADAASIVDTTVSMEDAAFASHIDFMAKTIASQKVAPKVEAPKEEDPADKNANLETLETAKANEKGGAALQPETNQVETVRASIADYLTKNKGKKAS